jgi:hypothetical protein
MQVRRNDSTDLMTEKQWRILDSQSIETTEAGGEERGLFFQPKKAVRLSHKSQSGVSLASSGAPRVFGNI